MHILILPSWYPKDSNDNVGTFFRTQAIAIAKSNIKVGVVTPSLRSLRNWKTILSEPYGISYEKEQSVSTYRNHGMAWIPRKQRPKGWNWSQKVSREYWVKKANYVFNHYLKIEGQPDLVHVHSMLNAGVLALQIKEKYQIPYVITEHSSWFARRLISKQQQVIIQRVAMSAKKRLAVSESLCNLLNSQFSLSDKYWEPTTNIVDQIFFQRKSKAPRPNSKEFHFSCIGFLTENKCIDKLIRAFAFNFSGQNWIKLRIGGDGPERVYLEKLAEEMKVQLQVEFLGNLSKMQVADTIAESDVLVSASNYETFGVVIIESLALGVPVISTTSGGPESIVTKDDGILIPPNDEKALSEAMNRMLVSIDRYNAAEIRHRCFARFSEKIVTKKLLHIYEEIISERSSDIKNTYQI